MIQQKKLQVSIDNFKSDSDHVVTQTCSISFKSKETDLREQKNYSLSNATNDKFYQTAYFSNKLKSFKKFSTTL